MEEEVVVEKVKDEVEEIVVEEKVEGMGMGKSGVFDWLREFLVHRVAGAILDLPWDCAVLDDPHPLGMDTPLLLPPGGPIWTLRFVLHRVHHKVLGQGRWVWVDERGVHPAAPLRLGGFRALGGVSRGMSMAAGATGGGGMWPSLRTRG